MAIQKITSGIIQDGAIAAADIVSVANTAITGNITSSQIAPDQTLNGNVSVTGSLNTPNTFGFKNRIINGGMNITQRNTSYTSANSENNDDTYVLDRFYILSDGNDAIDVTQTTTVPTGSKYSIGLDVETVNKKFGIAQIIENANCYDAIGGAVTVSFKAKVSSTTKLDNIKCAIVAWSGTADTVTSDIISAWGVEGTNPTLIANATYENTPVNLNVTTSFATYSVTATVDTASTSNLILFIWSDVTDTTLGDFLYITNVQLEVGSTATSFDSRDYGRELILCQRYFLNYTVASTCTSWSVNATQNLAIGFPVQMRSLPTYTGIISGAWSGHTPGENYVSKDGYTWYSANYFYGAGSLVVGFSAEL